MNNLVSGKIVEEDNNFLNVNEKSLPRVMQNQIEGINKISKSIKEAEEKAKLCEEKAQNALGKDINWLGMGTKDAIYSTQVAVKHTSEAVQSIIDVQYKTLEFQEKLSEITKHLFILGVSSLAKNRTIVRELELSLKGASKDKISELARKELMLVIKQLKDQEDILIKQENSEERLKELRNKLSLLDDTYGQKISELKIENKALVKASTKQNKNIGDIDKKLKKFEELEELKKKYNNLVNELNLLDNSSSQKISKLEIENKGLRKDLTKQNKSLGDIDKKLKKFEELEELKKKYNNLVNELNLLDNSSSQKISKLEIENKGLRKDLTKQNKNIDDIDEKLKKFEELEKLKKKYNNLVNELNLLDNSSSQKISKLEIENKGLRKDLTEHNKSLDDIHEKLKKLENFEGLEKKYNNLVWVSVILAFVITGSIFYFSLS